MINRGYFVEVAPLFWDTHLKSPKTTAQTATAAAATRLTTPTKAFLGTGHWL